MSDAVQLETVSAADFAPHVGSAFDLRLPDAEAVTLTLREVTPLGPAAASYPGRRPFSLLFAGPQDVRLPQSIYPLRHTALGALDLFLVPIRETADGRHYEAVFT